MASPVETTIRVGALRARAIPRENSPPPVKHPNLLRVAPADRVGKIQRQTRRALIVADGPITIAAIIEWAYHDKPWTECRRRHVRKAAERYAERVEPRTRPLRWRTKDAPSASHEDKSKG